MGRRTATRVLAAMTVAFLAAHAFEAAAFCALAWVLLPWTEERA